MIPTLYKEVEDLACKRQYLGGEYYFMNIISSNEVEDMVPQPPTVETGGYNEIPTDPPSCSRISGSSEEGYCNKKLYQQIVFLFLFYPCLQLIYFNLYILLFSMFIDNPLTDIQVLLVMF